MTRRERGAAAPVSLEARSATMASACSTGVGDVSDGCDSYFAQSGSNVGSISRSTDFAGCLADVRLDSSSASALLRSVLAWRQPRYFPAIAVAMAVNRPDRIEGLRSLMALLSAALLGCAGRDGVWSLVA